MMREWINKWQQSLTTESKAAVEMKELVYSHQTQEYEWNKNITEY